MKIRSNERRTALWQLRAARLALALGEPGSARSELRRLLGSAAETGIHSRGALRLLIDALLELGQFAEARRYVEVGCLAYPESRGFGVRGARLALLENNYAAAVQEATRIILADRNPRGDALAILAEGYAKTERPADALRIYRQLRQRLGARPVSAKLLVQYAEICLASGEPAEGLRLLDAIVQPPPLLQARLLAQSGRTRDALQAYDRLLVLAGIPGSAMPAAPVAVPFEQSGDAVELDEESLLAASLERIEILERLGDLRALRHLADWEIESPSSDARVRLALARALATAGQTMPAYQLIRHERNRPQYRAEFFGILLLIAEVEGRARLADRAARILSKGQRDAIIEAERRALLARILRGGALVGSASAAEATGRSADTVERESPLLRLMRNACGALAAANSASPGSADTQAHLTQCRVVLHRCRQKAA